MKTKYLVAILFAFLISVTGCDKGFEELNKDPLSPTTLDPAYQLASVESAFAGDTWHYEGCIIQQINLIITGQEDAGAHNIQVAGFVSMQWNRQFGLLKNTIDILYRMEQNGTNATRPNLYNMAKILKVWAFMNLVDNYGDVPFTEAGMGYYKANFFPKYDKQADIYAAIETDLIAATDALDATKDAVTNDMYYNGNIPLWKKFGNSLLLRLGMRYTKINPTKAASLANTAISSSRGGVMAANSDNLVIPFNATQNNPVTGFLRSSVRQNWHAHESFVNFLKNNNDPRAAYIICHYASPTSTTGGTRNTTLSAQIGAPSGYDPATISTAPGYPGTYSSNIWKYSFINRQTAGKPDGIAYMMTAAQTQLLLADATKRGWIAGGDAQAQTYYNNGITLAMNQTDVFAETRLGASPITSAQITTYLGQAGIAYNAATALTQINTQYWAASYLIWDEAWANWRRTGLPVLPRNNYGGADPAVLADAVGFIRRMTYPDSEYNYNKDNVQAAVTSIGGNGDKLVTRVFWDIN